MIDINELREAIQTFGSQAINEGDLNELLERLEAAEKDTALKERIIDSLGVTLTAVVNERDELFGSIEQMEKQAPVVEVQWAASIPNSFLDFMSTDGYLPKLGDKLYLAPGAKGKEKRNERRVQKMVRSTSTKP